MLRSVIALHASPGRRSDDKSGKRLLFDLNLRSSCRDEIPNVAAVVPRSPFRVIHVGLKETVSPSPKLPVERMPESAFPGRSTDLPIASSQHVA